MSTLSKQIVLGSIEILQDFTLQIREDTVINEDAVELSRIYTRYVLSPGDDVIGKPDPIPALANLLWTQEVIDTYKAKEAESLAQFKVEQ